MQFLLIIAHDDSFRPGRELVADIRRWIDAHTARGTRIRGAPLRPSAEAITVRVRKGSLAQRPGPFGVGPDHVAAFELVDCASLEEAVAIAASHPMAAVASIEVRAVWSELADS